MAWGQNVNPASQLHLGPKNYSATYQEAELLDIDVELADGDPYGRLLSGSLRLKGRWLPYRLWRGKTATYFATYWRKPMYHQGLLGRHKPDGRDQLICSFDEDEEHEDKDDEDEDERNANERMQMKTKGKGCLKRQQTSQMVKKTYVSLIPMAQTHPQLIQHAKTHTKVPQKQKRKTRGHPTAGTQQF